MLIENVNIATPPNNKFVSGKSLDSLEILEHQDIRVSNGKIESITPSSHPESGGSWVIPAFCDPHTHPVFAGTREDEIDLKKKIGYAEVLKRGGGIYRTIKSTAESDDYALYSESKSRVLGMMRNGTSIFECKTGYGITSEGEERMLRVAERLERELKIKIKKTLLAHVIPKGVREDVYLREFKGMIEEFRNRIDYVDVFVDYGAFSPSFARDAIEFSNSMGIPGRVHLNEIENLNGIEKLRGLDIKSYDHMIETRDDEIDSIRGAVTILPFTAITLGKGLSLFGKMKTKGTIMAIGSDLSPNTYVTSLPLVISLARQLSPFSIENLLNMSTLNACYTLSLSESSGSIQKGKDANLIFLKESYKMVGYKFGDDLVERVMINGKFVT